ncbi:hypothetical protein GIB67_020278 [Kingdonia uniflora]|uniref:PPM-type phosphatase domain-containing protein n=1 Tax=Kingdonia uniflora TaxID=39325 RepID=A0A7J7P3S0_9MAGN|nr:hypothetical protein GIB67_020278 [Kingdonia uniflora]
MGACCSKSLSFGGFLEEEEEYEDEENEGSTRLGDYGARVRTHGYCKSAAMFTQQGKKGINQDAMTIWESRGKSKPPGACWTCKKKGHFTCWTYRKKSHFRRDCNSSFKKDNEEKDTMNLTEEVNSDEALLLLCDDVNESCIVDSGASFHATANIGFLANIVKGDFGHKVASRVRDVLPSKISKALNAPNNDDNEKNNNNDMEDDQYNVGCDWPSFCPWKAGFIRAFVEMDKDLSLDSTIDTFCSGTTAVTLFKQGEHLIFGNLGDSRAILCTRDDKNQLMPVQLTVDLKPNLPSEAQRIKCCEGRVFSMEEEPDVYRLWLPNDDAPGLAMARAFGDFCLKDFGLISVPQISYRKISAIDEFIVLATDGVWDVLSNREVIKIVASVRRRSIAAKMVVRRAVRAWRHKYPTSKVDDCAAIILFLKSPVTKSLAGGKEESENKLKHSDSSKTTKSTGSHESPENKVVVDSKEWTALEGGVSRTDTMMKLARFPSGEISQRISIFPNGDSLHRRSI